jgi:CelD/BcsL family acetyltransferase involved in cellulose biosynthesis
MSMIALDLGASVAGNAAADATWAGHAVHRATSLPSLAADWQRLETCGGTTVFQSYAYVSSWLELAAAGHGETPVFFVGSRDGAVRFILPMSIVRRAGVPVLGWLGQAHANYGMPVAEPGTFAAGDVDDLIRLAGRLAGAAVVHLDRQPEDWQGIANPFATGAGSQGTANDTFVLELGEDYPALHARLFSSRTLSGLKRKQRKMAEVGPVAFNQPADAARRRDIFDWFCVEKHGQMARTGRGSVFDDPEIQSLYKAMAADEAGFQADELVVGEERVAVGLTAYHAGVATLINSAHVGGTYARFSPGTLLMHHMVATAHAKGARTYDFGPGELPYKLEWSPRVVGLRSTTLALSAAGLPLAALFRAQTWAKRVVKRNPRLMGLVTRLRSGRQTAGAPASAPD